MRNWRVITAIAAVVLAAIAGVLVWQYVDEADERAQEDQEPVEVLVAAGDIARGTAIPEVEEGESINLFETADFPAEDVESNWLQPGDEEQLANLVATADIPSGLPIVREQFIERGEVEGFSGLIDDEAPGTQAITISVDQSHGVAEFVTPNDYVNVLVTLDIGDLSSQSGDAATTTAFLIPGVKVLAVGQTTELGSANEVTYSRDTNGDGEINDEDEPDPQTPQSIQRGLLTLEVNPRQAEQIAQAVAEGTIYLTLNPDGFEPGDFQVPEEIVEALNLFDQPLPRVDEALRLLALAEQG